MDIYRPSMDSGFLAADYLSYGAVRLKLKEKQTAEMREDKTLAYLFDVLADSLPVGGIHLLLALNICLQGFRLVWANAYSQELIILMLIITAVSVEFIARGVYFRNAKMSAMIMTIVLFGIIGIAAVVNAFVWGGTFADDGGLTANSVTLVVGVLVLLIAIAALIRIARDRKNGCLSS